METFIMPPGEYQILTADEVPTSLIEGAGQGVMVLAYGTEPLEVEHRSKILDEWLIPVATTEFLKQNSEIRAPGDLRARHLLHDDVAWRGASPYAEWNAWLEYAQVHDMDLEGGQRYNLSTLAIEAVLANQGIAMGRVSMIMEDLLARRLITVFNTAIISPASYWLIRPEHKVRQGDIVQSWLEIEAQSYDFQRKEFIRTLESH